MKRFALRSVLTAALAAACLASPAVQAATTVASLGGFNVTLVDLTPDDGIAPSLTFQGLGAVVVAGVATVPGLGVDDIAFDLAAGESVNGLLAHNQSGTTAAVAALQGPQLQAMGSVGTFGEFTSSAAVFANFTLSANTKLVFNALASLSSDFAGGNPYNLGSAGVAVEIIDQQGGDAVGLRAEYLNELYTFETGVGSVFDLVSLSFSNTTGAALDGTLTMAVNATGAITPVPEPSSWLMLGTGMLVAGAAARRARRAN